MHGNNAGGDNLPKRTLASHGRTKCWIWPSWATNRILSSVLKRGICIEERAESCDV